MTARAETARAASSSATVALNESEPEAKSNRPHRPSTRAGSGFSANRGLQTKAQAGQPGSGGMFGLGRPVIQQIKDAGLVPPQSLTLMITDGCNLKCRHCWLDCRPAHQAKPVAAAVLLRILDEFAGLGGTKVHLTGGEVFTHPDWARLLRFCCHHPLIDSVCLQTNATLLSAPQIDVLLSLPPGKLFMQVSVDGASAEIHDLIRGPGSFEAALRGLEMLVAAGLGQRTQVAFTEMVHNFDDLPRLLEWLSLMGVGRLISGTVIMGGRAARNAKVSPPTPAQYSDLILLYQSDPYFRELYDRQANIAAIEWFKGREQSSGMECSCMQNLFISASGDVYPCVMLFDRKFAAQNVHRHPLPEVIQSALPRWGELPEIHRRRGRELVMCQTCPGRRHCAGGCAGRAYASQKEMMVPEDRCALRKAVYYWKMP
jgi:radical SAM protein with 4Fe4S-binding SPASM domain